MANLPLTLGNVLGTTQPGMTASNDVITLSSKPQYSINYVDVDAGLGTDQLRLTGYSTLTSGKFTISTPDSNGWIHIDTISGASSTEFHIRVKSVESVTFYGGTTVQLSYVDTTPPTLSTSNPVNTATGVAVNSNIVLTFSETVQKGSGAIEIHSGSASGPTVATYDVAATNTSILTFSGSTLTINPTDDLAYSTTYFFTIALGAVKDLSNNSYSGITTYDFTTVADTILPTVTAFSPTDAATGVPAARNIVLTFSEAIQKGTGLIEIHSGSATGPTFATYDAATNTSNLTFSGNTLTINPTADLASDGTQYFVTLASGTVTDLAVKPNIYTGTTTYDFFTLDTTPPTVTTFSPTDAAKGVAVGSNIVLTFSEMIQKGAGAIEIHSGSAIGPTVATYDAANSSNLTFSGNTLTINPTADLASDGTQYFVTLVSGTVKDLAGNPYAGTTTYDFFTLDTTPPTVTVFSPADAAPSVAFGSNIVLTFSEAIQKGTGTIAIHADSATGTLLEPAYDAATNTSNLTFSGNTLTINPTNLLAAGTQYFVTFAAGSVLDSAGYSYIETTPYHFTTTPTVDNTAPLLSTSNPGDGVAGVAVNSDIVLTFSEAVQKGSGAIAIHSGSATGQLVATYDAATNTTNLTFSGNTLTINPTDDLANSTKYFVTIASGAVTDLSNNNYLGTTTYDFTTVPDTTPPTVTIFSPKDAATGVLPTSNIVLTFSEAVQKGTGGIEIHAGSATGTLLEPAYDVSTNTSNLTFSGNTLTINPTIDLASDGNHYFVILAQDTVKDLAGNPLYAGISTYDFFTLDTTPPRVTSFSPTVAATGVAAGSNIVLTFSEAIQKGAGVIAIHSGSADGPTVATYDAATNTLNLTFPGNSLTINPTADLASDGTHYFITLAPGTVYDLAGNLYTETTNYNFTTVDTTPPVTAFAAPATGVAVGSNIELTFSETIRRGTGAIAIHAGSIAGPLLEPAYDATTNTSNLTFSGNTLTINPTNTLATDTHYFVALEADSVRDIAGNNAGITNYDFTTVDTIAPTVTSFSPTEAATGVPVGSDILITFSEAVHSGTGLIVIHSGSETGAVVASYESATNTSNLTFSGNMLTINPTDNLAADTHFFVTLQNGSVNDLAGNHYAGTAAYDFTTGADPYAGSSGSSSNIGVDAGPVVVGVGGLGVLAWVLFF
jgi:methionine-rich copper-binding protein CopC